VVPAATPAADFAALHPAYKLEGRSGDGMRVLI